MRKNTKTVPYLKKNCTYIAFEDTNMGLIDELMQSLSKDVDKIKVRAQTMLDAYNLSHEIKELQSQKTDRLLSIGKFIYDKYQQQTSPTEEPLQQHCTDIAALEKDIRHLQNRLDDLKMQTNSADQSNDSNNTAAK